MNCTQAREILNLLLDGEECSNADVAREHLAVCSSCREWHAGMERVVRLAESASAGLPAPDLSASIMSRLPARHPASVRPRTRSWLSRRGLIWVAASWVVGVIALVAAWLVVSRWVAGPSAGSAVVLSYDLTRVCLSVGRVMSDAMGAVVGAFRSALPGLTPHAISYGLAFLALDSTLLCAAFLIWRTRRRIPGAMSILV